MHRPGNPSANTLVNSLGAATGEEFWGKESWRALTYACFWGQGEPIWGSKGERDWGNRQLGGAEYLHLGAATQNRSPFGRSYS